jgi:hypothetical protein
MAILKNKTMNKPIRINNIKKLKSLASHENGLDCFISLNFSIKSSKHIQWIPAEKLFYILNEVDNTEQNLKEEELLDENITNIGKALKLGALYYVEMKLTN